MNGLNSSRESEYSSRFAFLSSRLASIRASVADWAPIPLRLIVGYGFMEHGFANAWAKRGGEMAQWKTQPQSGY